MLLEQAADRVPELVPIRHGRMLASPFAFFRGAAALMAADLAETPQSGLTVQLCGDAHLSNFGGFASPARELVFDINDFDETARGPWEWDVKRLAASIAIAGRELGLTPAARRDAVESAVRSYREAMRRFATMRNLELWYARLDVARDPQPRRRPGDRGGAQGVRATGRGRARQGSSACDVEAGAARRRRSADRKPPAAHRPGGGGVPRDGSRGGRGADAQPSPCVPPQPPG